MQAACAFYYLPSVISAPMMLLILNVWTGESFQFSLYTHILKLLLLVLGLLLKMLLLQNVWIWKEDVRLSLYTHVSIEVVIACTWDFVKGVIVTECVDKGRTVFGYLSIPIY